MHIFKIARTKEIQGWTPFSSLCDSEHACHQCAQEEKHLGRESKLSLTAVTLRPNGWESGSHLLAAEIVWYTTAYTCH